MAHFFFLEHADVPVYLIDVLSGKEHRQAMPLLGRLSVNVEQVMKLQSKLQRNNSNVLHRHVQILVTISNWDCDSPMRQYNIERIATKARQ